MKHLIPLLVLAAFGCGHKSEFDISPAQAAQGKPHIIGGVPDLDHLPPGAVKNTKVYHKGDILPDGSVSDGERKVVTINVKR